MKTAITGATGQLGSRVVELLKEKLAKEDIIALVHTPEKATGLGVEARAFDYTKPEMLVKGLQGVDNLLLISSSEIGHRARQHANVIEAAKEAGVKWIVYTSLLHADHSSLSLAAEHLSTEAMLKDSGMKYTILRNGWYTGNYTSSIAGAMAGGAFIGSAGNGKISSASRDDYAEAAADVISDESHQGMTYELAGDNSYTLSDLAAEISKQTGKNIPYKDMPAEEYANILKSFNIPEGFADAIAGWDVSASEGALFDNEHQLSHLIGHPTTPLAESVKLALAG